MVNRRRASVGMALALLAVLLQAGCGWAARPIVDRLYRTVTSSPGKPSLSATRTAPTTVTPTRTATPTVDVLMRMVTLDAILPSPSPLGLWTWATPRPSRAVGSIPTVAPPRPAASWTPVTPILIPTLTPTPTPPPPTSRQITYRVWGAVPRALVSYRNAHGGTEQRLVYVPWSTGIRMPIGQLAALRARNPQPYGSIRVEILLDGQLWRWAGSSGPHIVASCQGIVE